MAPRAVAGRRRNTWWRHRSNDAGGSLETTAARTWSCVDWSRRREALILRGPRWPCATPNSQAHSTRAAPLPRQSSSRDILVACGQPLSYSTDLSRDSLGRRRPVFEPAFMVTLQGVGE